MNAKTKKILLIIVGGAVFLLSCYAYYSKIWLPKHPDTDDKNTDVSKP